LLKKAEDAEVDTAEQSAIKLRSQQQTSSALVVADQPPANGSAPVTNHLTLVKMPSQTIYDNQERSLTYEEAPKPPTEVPKENGAPFDVGSKTTNVPEVNIESKAEPPSTPNSASPADLLADLLGPLAIEGPPPVEQHPPQGLEANQSSVGDLALATLEDQSKSVQVLVYSYFLYLGCILIQHFLKDGHTIPAILFYGDVFYLHLPNEFCFIQPIIDVEEKFHILCTKDSGVLYEDPHIQVCISLNKTRLFLSSCSLSALS
jgi:AP-2 complex subunit alpha